MKSKFDFYEIVKVSSVKKDLQEINDSLGIVRGMSQSDENQQWGYAVSIEKDNWFLWDIEEEDLQPTGKKANPKDFMTGESIRVRVDPETGEGEIVEDDLE